MELAEEIKTINDSLTNLYGHDFTTLKPIFRVVWSNDQFEKRLMNVTDEGFTVLTPVVREVPKYRQWIQDRYVLERLVLVPAQQQNELADIVMSYEPLFVFQNSYDGTYLPPRIDACKFVIDSLYATMGKKSLRKYVDSDKDNPQEVRELRVGKLMTELFGNETNVGDALAYKEGVFIPAKPTDAASPSIVDTGDKHE